jgi:hypothetical protein
LKNAMDWERIKKNKNKKAKVLKISRQASQV